MRLKKSRPACEEQILRSLNTGYEASHALYLDYTSKRDSGEFDAAVEVASYGRTLNEWLNATYQALLDLFPTPLEANVLTQRFSSPASHFLGMHDEVAVFVYVRWPTYLERLYNILERHLPRYTDLPLAERLHVEDVDSFARVRDINRSLVMKLLQKGRLEWAEEAVQLAIEAILDVPFHRVDWGGEINDLYTANLVVNGRRRPAAFMLKGNGLRVREMQIRDCGANGDQLIRLFQSPAELFVVQYIGAISDAVVADVHGKTLQRRALGFQANYMILDGQDTARLLVAYGKLTPLRSGLTPRST